MMLAGNWNHNPSQSKLTLYHWATYAMSSWSYLQTFCVSVTTHSENTSDKLSNFPILDLRHPITFIVSEFMMDDRCMECLLFWSTWSQFLFVFPVLFCLFVLDIDHVLVLIPCVLWSLIICIQKVIIKYYSIERNVRNRFFFKHNKYKCPFYLEQIKNISTKVLQLICRTGWIIKEISLIFI